MRIEEIRRGLTSRLRARRTEIERAILTRVHSVSDSDESPDPEYTDGLRAAVAAALDYGIEAVERSEDHPPPMPTVLLSQARLAARHGVKLETVLRRYLAGYTLLGDFMIEESERGGPLEGASLKRLLRVLAAFDAVVAHIHELVAEAVEAAPDWPHQAIAAVRNLVPPLERGRGERSAARELPPTTEDSTIGALVSLAGRKVATGEAAQLEDLLPDFTEFILSPYLGPAEAARLARAAA